MKVFPGDIVKCTRETVFVDNCMHENGQTYPVKKESAAYYNMFIGNGYELYSSNESTDFLRAVSAIDVEIADIIAVKKFRCHNCDSVEMSEPREIAQSSIPKMLENGFRIAATYNFETNNKIGMLLHTYHRCIKCQ